MTKNFKFRIFINGFDIKVKTNIYIPPLMPTGFIEIFLWYVLLYLLTTPTNLSKNLFFDITIMCF